MSEKPCGCTSEIIFLVSYPPSSVSVVEYKEDNEAMSSEDRKQRFLVVADPTSSYDEASSKPIFSTSLDEPMDSETKDLETLQSHIISESTGIYFLDCSLLPN